MRGMRPTFRDFGPSKRARTRQPEQRADDTRLLQEIKRAVSARKKIGYRDDDIQLVEDVKRALNAKKPGRLS